VPHEVNTCVALCINCVWMLSVRASLDLVLLCSARDRMEGNWNTGVLCFADTQIDVWRLEHKIPCILFLDATWR
jgi:hypothetical protein